jgi:hypothetical protein
MEQPTNPNIALIEFTEAYDFVCCKVNQGQQMLFDIEQNTLTIEGLSFENDVFGCDDDGEIVAPPGMSAVLIEGSERLPIPTESGSDSYMGAW